jgi:hypothetical protein
VEDGQDERGRSIGEGDDLGAILVSEGRRIVIVDRVSVGCSVIGPKDEGALVDPFRVDLQGAGCDLGGASTSTTISDGGREPDMGFSEVEESVFCCLPSYRDVLSRTPLQVFDGGVLVTKPIERSGRVESSNKEGGRGSRIENSLIKGVVLGGLEKEFSPLKTRSARKLVKEKEALEVTSGGVQEGLRALRAQKSLARVKK